MDRRKMTRDFRRNVDDRVLSIGECEEIAIDKTVIPYGLENS